LAASYDAELLASLPLSMAIRLQCDGGEPTASADPDSQIAMIYQQLARTVAARISVLNQHSAAMPSIEVSDD
jgi:ATP-binding protein involved in chromosome partitioning